MSKGKRAWKVERFEVDVIEDKIAIVWAVDSLGQIDRDSRVIVPVGKGGSIRLR